MLDAPAYPTFRATAGPALPVEKLVIGQDVERAAALLPRLFNLCRVAQEVAARAAFGVPLQDDWRESLRREILRAHVANLAVKWPVALGLAPLALPADWQTNASALRAAMFGKAGIAPQTPAGFDAFLAAGQGVAPVLSALRDRFAPGVGCRAELPLATPASLFQPRAQDNSIAAQHAAHPLMRAIEEQWGRGPLWAGTALVLDLDKTLAGDLPEAQFAPGRAVVPAARGLYGVKAAVEGGRVTRFARITPTDHLLQARGVLDQSLASLPPSEAAALAPVLIAVLDPCVPLTLQPGGPRHA